MTRSTLRYDSDQIGDRCVWTTISSDIGPLRVQAIYKKETNLVGACAVYAPKVDGVDPKTVVSAMEALVDVLTKRGDGATAFKRGRNRTDVVN